MVKPFSKPKRGFDLKFIWPFGNGHGCFETAIGFKTASNIFTDMVTSTPITCTHHTPSIYYIQILFINLITHDDI